jgi:hypothetical protein
MRRGTNLFALAFSDKNYAFFNEPYPVCEGAIENEVCYYSGQGPDFGLLPAEFPVEVEKNGCYDDGGPAKDQPHVCVSMILLEFEGRKVVL